MLSSVKCTGIMIKHMVHRLNNVNDLNVYLSAHIIQHNYGIYICKPHVLNVWQVHMLTYDNTTMHNDNPSLLLVIY